MNTTPESNNSSSDIINNFQFDDVFNLEEIQRLQDLFSDVSGIASIITHPDGTPITKPSNYCRLCDLIIPKTNNGPVRCYQPDTIMGRNNTSKDIIWPCQNEALWNLGATITVGDKHIANWLTGKVLNEALKELIISSYANETKANWRDLVEALSEVPVVTIEQSNKVSGLLVSFAKELSEKGNNNLLLKIQIAKQEKILKELREKEEILIESEERYRSLFDNMLNGCAYCQMLFENSLPSDFIYLNVNKAFETLTGLINVEGKRATEVIPGIKESDNSLFEIYSRVALTGKPEIFEMHVESLNDWYSVSVYSPKREFFIAVFDVITERKLSERELINAKEKAEESDRLKTAFLNNISHEIRTPFNGILGFLSLLQDHDLEDDEREEYISIINQSADRLMNTINDIVEVSHIQSGLVKLAMQNTNIKQLTDDLIDKFGAFAEKKELEFIITNDLPNNITSIFTDGIKLKTILTNLIGNALKFTRIGSVELCLKKKNDILEFSVKDTGIGISKNKQQIIFERFMQSTVSNTREFEGLGLGLTIVKAYVKMLGGKLWMESEEGKGTTFNFTIPYIDNTDK
jgi:signal transduction histidine kinase/ligand-binding sensor protein